MGVRGRGDDGKRVGDAAGGSDVDAADCGVSARVGRDAGILCDWRGGVSRDEVAGFVWRLCVWRLCDGKYLVSAAQRADRDGVQENCRSLRCVGIWDRSAQWRYSGVQGQDGWAGGWDLSTGGEERDGSIDS